MDNTAQNTNQISATGTKPIEEDLQNRITQPTKAMQQAPVSSMNKEKDGGNFSENIKPSEPEIKVNEQLRNIGIVANTDKPKLDEVHEQIGVKASAEASPVVTQPIGKVALPMSEEEVDQTLKMGQSKFNLHENVGAYAGEYTEDSLPFLATLIKKIFKEMHKKLFY